MKEGKSISEEDLTDTGDGGIVKTILKEGEGDISPTEDSIITVKLKGTNEGEIFDHREVTFTLGFGYEQNIVKGIETAIGKFKRSEIALLTISYIYAFGEIGSKDLNVPPCACVQYEVELIDFMEPKQLWELTPAEKISLAERYKSKGTHLYKSSFINEALTAYFKAKLTLEEDPSYSVQEVQERAILLLHISLNCALCQLKTCQWNEAIASCNTVLEVQLHNEKALYRKAEAYMGRGDYTEAINQFQAVLDVNPSNKAASSSILKAKQKLKDANDKAKQKYAGMFQKFADKDNKEEALAKARGALNNEPIGYWSNDMAAGMMSLQQEMEAFGERMPERSRKLSEGSGGGSPRQ